MRIETQILSNLINNEDYLRKVAPFLKPDYFTETDDRVVFGKISDYIQKYNDPPAKSALLIALQDDRSISEDLYVQCETLINSLNASEVNNDWLVDETEKFCKDKAVYNAIMDSIQIIDGSDKNRSPDALPSILSDALAVGFDNNVGHDYIENADDRFDFYNRVEEKIPFDLEFFNKITEGGLPNKTLNIALAGTGVGKSLFMCHAAAGALSMNKNVLYITMEMSEERIAERIDANLLDCPLDQIEKLTRESFVNKVSSVAAKTQGKLIIKEYPTGQAHSGHFRALLNELKLKKKFVPDIIYIDYLNICSSSRIKGLGGSVNTYSFIKSIAEELRGLAVEFDVPIVSATQTTRSGYGNSDPGLEDTSESFGLPATADLMLALVSNDELEKLGQVMVKQLKNRYSDPNNHKRFVLGINRAKMRLFDVEEAELGLIDDGPDVPVFDVTPTGKKLNTEGFNV